MSGYRYKVRLRTQGGNVSRFVILPKRDQGQAKLAAHRAAVRAGFRVVAVIDAVQVGKDNKPVRKLKSRDSKITRPPRGKKSARSPQGKQEVLIPHESFVGKASESGQCVKAGFQYGSASRNPECATPQVVVPVGERRSGGRYVQPAPQRSEWDDEVKESRERLAAKKVA